MNIPPLTSRTLLTGLAACILGVVAACEVGPNYSRPDLQTSANYKSPNSQTQPSVHLGDNWWLLFNDYSLTLLENAARLHNPDIAAAVARVDEARAVTRDVKSAFFPVISLDPSVTRAREPVRVSGGRSTTATDISIPFDLTYEVDIWGRIRRTYEASQATLRASRADYYLVLQTIEADVAQDYYLLRSLELQDNIFTQNIALYDDQLRLTKIKLGAHILGNIDLVQVQNLRDSAITDQLDIRRQRDDAAHALAILTGRAPADFSLDKTADLPAPPVIPAGLPSDILRQRPDVAEAEQNLIAANANVGVAVANFYPVVHLTGAAGLESFDTQHIFDWESTLWSLGPSVTFPIFEGGKLHADLDQAKARYVELTNTFRSTVLVAFRDVEVSLTDIHAYNDSVAAQEQAVKSAAEYVRLAQVELQSGIFSTLEVIDADRTLLTNQITLAQLRANRLTSTVLLIKALGGGWDPNQLTIIEPTTQITTQPAQHMPPIIDKQTPFPPPENFNTPEEDPSQQDLPHQAAPAPKPAPPPQPAPAPVYHNIPQDPADQ